MVGTDVTITYEGKEVVVTLGKMSWGNKSDMLNYAIGKIRMLGGETPQVEVDIAKFKEGVVAFSIQETDTGLFTKGMTIDAKVALLRKMEGDQFEKIYKEAATINPFRDIF